ncbi:MAG: putative Ig domain-containing protein [Verrucomicrobia bacterium]|nr:putative Ig domain-containing protein [Verrucomicrobiota bacterium]
MFIVSSFRALRGLLGLVAGLAFLAISQPTLNAQTGTPSAADGFDPNVNGTTFALATQADGKIIVGGTFDNVGGYSRSNLARVNIDASVDPTFDPSVNGKITTIVVQPDGKILVGGYFSTFKPNGAATAVARNNLARLNPDGTVDPTFNPNFGGALAPGVEAIAIQADGKILVGGTFTTVQPNGAATATTRNRLARLNADGSLDTSFNPNPDRVVLSIAMQADGKIIIGGGFTKVQPNGDANATTRNGLARLNADGSVDATYDPNLNNGVTKVAVTPDGKVIAVGYFTSAAPNNAGAASTASHIARFNTDGSLDTAYAASVNGNVMALELQDNGGVLVGGTFTSVSGLRRNYVARLTVNGYIDGAFDPSANYTVFALAEQSDGSVLIGGNFTQLQPNGAAAPTTRNGLARVNANGTLDSEFNPDTNGRVLVVRLQSDGKALVGGSFTSIAGVTRYFMARLNTDGSLDTSFDPGLNGTVTAIAMQNDGKILVGGYFTTVKGTVKLHMARLNADGSLDPSFEPNPDNSVNAIAVQSDGKIVIGGYFQTVRPNGSAVQIARSRIARINSDGSLDSTWDPVCAGPVLALVIQTDGKILAGGNFLGFATGNRANIARINPDGTLDATYNPSANGPVNAIALQTDGKIVVGGSFTYLQPVNAPVVTTTTKNPDGTTTTSKTTISFRLGVARINTDGTVDPDFNPTTSNVVRAVAIQSDNKILIGGLFTSLTPNTDASVSRIYLARVDSTGKLDPTFDLGIAENFGNQVIALAVQGDGKILVGGAFKTMNPGGKGTVVRNQLARVNADSTIDAGYNPGAGGPSGAVINSITIQADTRILVGGQFTTYGGTSSNNLARFEAESVPDAYFNPNPTGPVYSVSSRISGGSQGTQLPGFVWLNNNGTLRNALPAAAPIGGQISVIVRQPDGKFLVAGSVTDTTNRVGANLIRLNADGSLDTSFKPTVDNTVNAVALQSDGKIVIGGTFLNVGGVARQYVARVNADGTLDTGFNPTANAQVNAILVQPDGAIILGGAFNTLQPNGATSSSSINYLARVKSDGSFDNTFGVSPNSTVSALALQPDGSVIVGGAFTTVLESPTSTKALTRNHLARVNPDNTSDKTFDPSPSGTVSSIVVQSDGKIVFGGNFAFVQPNGAGYITTRNNLARVNADGTLDSGFNPNPNNPVTAIALQSDGKLLLAGPFSAFQPPGVVTPITRAFLARVNADGSLDNSFDPEPNSSVSAILALADGSVVAVGTLTSVEPVGSLLVGGSFDQIGGVPLNNVALLNSGGSASASFAPNPNGPVYSIISRPDNRVLIAGSFSTIAGAARSGIAQVNLDGTIDASFSASPSVTGPAALVLQPDGKILLGGAAVGYGGAARGTLERLNADGTIDATFNPSGLGAVNAVALQPDGKILVGGAAPSALVRLNADGSLDSSFNPAPNGNVNAIVVQSDGKILVGGAFTSIGGSAISYLARLSSAGAVETGYNPAPNGVVTALTVQAGGKVILGGSFTAVGGRTRYGLARIAMTSPASQSIDVSGNFSTITWTRGGSGPALIGVTFEQSTDGRSWTVLGSAARVGNTDTWQLAGQSLYTGTNLFIRAHGLTLTSQYASYGLVEAVRQFYSSALPQIVSASSATAFNGSSFFFGVTTNVTGATFSASGLPAGLTIDPSSGIISGTPTQTGVFSVVLTAANAAGTANQTLTLYVNASGGGGSVVRFVNISARAPVTASDPLIAGLVISGTAPQTVLLRAIGPALTNYGISSAIPHPRMRLYNAAGALLSENAGWGGASALMQVFNQVGAFPLPAGSPDSAMLVTLAPGQYTVAVSDVNSQAGIALAEVYDTSSSASSTAPRLVNLSARSTANSGLNVMVGGFVVNGSASKRVLIRGVGPTLANYGVSSYMTDPVLKIFDKNGALIAINDNWGTPYTANPSYPAVSAAEISLANGQAGAFAYASGSLDAAVVVVLPPGSYTAQVESATTTDGTALVEIYELP